ncbi:MAG TPA: hypothetical protein DCK98_12510 [Chloroflexi bacterium]|nr:hypothetical protein [Chloroflexota bacterium]HAL28293.1 hypothetical protein [Chloroflexota bacterium]
MIFRSARVSADELDRVTGWELKPEGLCQMERCVPFSSGSSDAIDLAAVSRALGMPLVVEPRARLWALGTEAGGRALESATLPDLELPDLEGRPFRFSALRGRKAFLLAWASW